MRQLVFGVLVGVAISAALSNPSQQDFSMFFLNWLRKRIVDSPPASSWYERIQNSVTQAVNTLGSRFTTPQFYNLGLLHVAQVGCRGQTLLFVGILGRWYSLGSVDQEALTN